MSGLWLTEEQVAILDGWFEAYDDFPDGAWLAACQEACETICKTEPSFRGLDAGDVWHAWMVTKGEEALATVRRSADEASRLLGDEKGGEPSAV